MCQKLWKLAGSRQSYCKNYLAYFFGPPCTGSTRKEHIWEKLKKELKNLRKSCDRQSCADNVDSLLTKLTVYHNRLLSQANNIVTQKLSSAEVRDVVRDSLVVDDVNHAYRWSKDDESTLNVLNNRQGTFRRQTSGHGQQKRERISLCTTTSACSSWWNTSAEMVIKHCDKCKCTGIIYWLRRSSQQRYRHTKHVGMDQVGS